jgi:hypothetical protein
MFVPIHHIAHGRKSKGCESRGSRPAAAIAAALCAATAGLASSMSHGIRPHGGLATLSVVLVTIAVVGGFVLARVIGKQGRI